jgi:hypothetical protein
MTLSCLSWVFSWNIGLTGLEADCGAGWIGNGCRKTKGGGRVVFYRQPYENTTGTLTVKKLYRISEIFLAGTQKST